MRLLKLLPLLILPSLLLGATCVTHVEQKGPAGPWIGELTNMGPDSLEATSVMGYVVDANGNNAIPALAQFCPPLQSGEKGYFTVREIASGLLDNLSPAPVLPLRLLRIEGHPSRPPFTSGLAFRVLQVDEAHQAIMVEMRNNSSNTYQHLIACTVLFSPPGEVQEIATKRVFPGVDFGPGDTVAFPVHFDSSVNGASFVFGLDAGFGSPLNVTLPSSAFELSAYKIVETDNGRELRAVGEITNNTPNDLAFAVYEAYLKTSPTVRVSGSTGPSGADFRTGTNYWDGNGLIIAGQRAPIRFSLPLDEDDAPEVEIAAIEAGIPAEGEVPRQYFPIPVSDVGRQRIDSGSVSVSASISNPTDEHMLVAALCFNLRGSHDELVGSACVSGPSRGLAAGESAVVSGAVAELAPTRSVEVIAYGFSGFPVTPPT